MWQLGITAFRCLPLTALDIHLIPERFSGIPGFCDLHGAPLKLQGIQGIFHWFGERFPAGKDAEKFLIGWSC